MSKFSFFIFMTALLVLSQESLAVLAGHVILSKGGSTATNEQGEVRTLKRRSKIMEGDLLSTGANGMLQIRFVDKALLTLKSNSQLNVSAYVQAKQQGDEEAVVMNLLKGGFRTITGTIGKGEKSAYKVSTPAASIGIRGTNYEVAQEVGESFVMAVWEGGISVSNDQGSLDLGQDSDFQFLRVSPNTEPQGLETIPDTLTTTSTPPPKKSDDESDSDSNADDDSNDGESDTETTDDSEQDQSDDTEESTTEDTEEGVVELTDDADNTANTDSAESEAKDSELEQELDEVEEEANAIVNEPLPDLEQITSIDTRFTDWEYTYLVERPKAVLIVDENQSSIANGLLVQDTDAGTDPVFVLAGDGTGTDNNVESFTIDIENGVEYNASVGGNSNVSWGQWNGDVEYFSIANDNTTSTTQSQSFYWLSAEAASLSSLRGTAQFTGNTDFLGDINGESINTFNGQFDVNFNSGAISNGSMNIGNNTESWSMTYDGTVTGANATMNNIQGSVTGGTGACTTCVSGDLQGVFARPGDQFIGGFKLQTDQSGQANGIFSLDGSRTE